MAADADLATIGTLLGDRTRAAILLALMGGDAQPAGALAEAAGASPSLASSHLRKLTQGGLITVRADGRRRLYALASQQTAEALEALMLVAPRAPVTSLKQAGRYSRIRHARLCYDHLAGVLGVAVTDALVDRGALRVADHGFDVPAGGEDAFVELGVDLTPLREARRPLTRACVDLTERRPHLAGGLGAAVADAMLERRWVARKAGTRALSITAAGAREIPVWTGRPLTAS